MFKKYTHSFLNVAQVEAYISFCCGYVVQGPVL